MEITAKSSAVNAAHAPYDPQIATLICDFIAQGGFTENQAAIYAGIHTTTLRYWRRISPEFLQLLVSAHQLRLKRKPAPIPFTPPLDTAIRPTSSSSSSSSSSSNAKDAALKEEDEDQEEEEERKPRTRPGRPTKFTDDLDDQICDFLRAFGCSDTRAGKAFGVCANSISRWKRENPDFAARLDIARTTFFAARMRLILAALTKAGCADWRAHKWLLERLFPEECGPKRSTNNNHSSHSSHSTPSYTSEEHPSWQMTDEELNEEYDRTKIITPALLASIQRERAAALAKMPGPDDATPAPDSPKSPESPVPAPAQTTSSSSSSSSSSSTPTPDPTNGLWITTTGAALGPGPSELPEDPLSYGYDDPDADDPRYSNLY